MVLSNIGIKDCELLGKCLYELESLETLVLSNNQITPGGVILIANALLRSFKFWSLDLSFNRLAV